MQKNITKNKKAFFDYEILETWEAGIELKGFEVKSIRQGKVNLKGSYISFVSGFPTIKGCHISLLPSLPSNIIDPKRDRKIFIHKKAILYLSSKGKEAGKAIIPLELYFSGSLIKVKIGLALGRKKYDKKQVLKERTMDKEAKQQMKHFI